MNFLQIKEAGTMCHLKLIKGIAMISGTVLWGALVVVPAAFGQTTAAQLPKPRRGDAALLRPAQGKPITPTNQNEFNSSPARTPQNIELKGDSSYYAPTSSILPNNYNATPQSSVLRTPGTFSNDPVPAVQILQATPERAAPSGAKKAD
ncbi:MAG: hypothetical protein ACK5QS_14045 [Pseudanabaenaceae cyanobacterium]